MEFDERLHHAFETLAERLHQDISAQLTAVRADLAGSIEAERDAAVANAVRQAEEAAQHQMRQAEEAAQRQIREAEEAAERGVREAEEAAQHKIGEAEEAARRGVREAEEAAQRGIGERLAESVARTGMDVRAEVAAVQKAASDRLVEAIRAIDGAYSLSEILDALVTSASAEGGRVAVFLPQGSVLKGWRLAGFDAVAHNSGVEVPVAEGGVIAEAVETARLVCRDPAAPHASSLPSFVELPDQARALAVPLVMSGQVLAVLYADEGGDAPANRESWTATIEVLARHAARALEAITAARLAQVSESLVESR